MDLAPTSASTRTAYTWNKDANDLKNQKRVKWKSLLQPRLLDRGAAVPPKETAGWKEMADLCTKRRAYRCHRVHTEGDTTAEDVMRFFRSLLRPAIADEDLTKLLIVLRALVEQFLTRY